MCGLSFLYYCSHKRISLFLFFFLKSRFLTLWWEIRGVYFCLPKTKLVCILFLFFCCCCCCFICKLYTFSWWTKAVCHFFCNQVVFLVLFLLSFVICKLYILWYAEDKSLFSLPEVEVLDRTQGLFSWSLGSKWNCWIRWASVLSWWKCDLLL